MKKLNLIGKRFGKLFVLSKSPNDKWGNNRWLCLCDCTNIKIIRGDSLLSKTARSCGCSRIKHGHNKRNKRSKTYAAWTHMNQRCFDIKCKEYKHYGKRKITVCDRWFPENNGFINFLSDMGKCPGKGYSLDRINNSLGYYKENCRWATSFQQHRNMRSNKMVTFKNKTLCLSDWAKKLNIEYMTLWSRIYRYGWSIEKSLTKSVRLRK